MSVKMALSLLLTCVLSLLASGTSLVCDPFPPGKCYGDLEHIDGPLHGLARNGYPWYKPPGFVMRSGDASYKVCDDATNPECKKEIRTRMLTSELIPGCHDPHNPNCYKKPPGFVMRSDDSSTRIVGCDDPTNPQCWNSRRGFAMRSDDLSTRIVGCDDPTNPQCWNSRRGFVSRSDDSSIVGCDDPTNPQCWNSRRGFAMRSDDSSIVGCDDPTNPQCWKPKFRSHVPPLSFSRQGNDERCQDASNPRCNIPIPSSARTFGPQVLHRRLYNTCNPEVNPDCWQPGGSSRGLTKNVKNSGDDNTRQREEPCSPHNKDCN